MRPKLNWKPPVDAEPVNGTPAVAQDKPWSPPKEATPVKKKDDTASPSSSVSPAPAAPSKPSSEKSSSSDKWTSKYTGKSYEGGLTLQNVWDDLVTAYNTPSDPKDKAPTPILNAIKRGTSAAETAGVVGPFEDKPTLPEIQKVAKMQQATRNLPSSEAYKKFNEAKTFGESAKRFADKPVQILAELTAESLSSMFQYGASRVATGAATGAALGSVVPGIGTAGGAGGGAIVGMADTSLGLEFSGSFMESLQEAGVDTTDPEQLRKAFENDDVISTAREHAFKKGIPIALFDLISGGIAGKIVSRPAKSLIGKVGAGAIELAIQSAMGASGELAGQVVAGEDIQPSAILAEALGETAMAPVEVAVGATTFNKAPTQVVEEQTQIAIPSNDQALGAKAEVIQDKIDANEEKIIKGQQGTVDAIEVVPQVTTEQDAIQERATTEVPPREAPRDSGAVGEGDTTGQTAQEGDQKGSEQEKDLTPKDIHTAAKEADIDPETKAFRDKSKELTGKEHLDDMTPQELRVMKDYIDQPPPAPPETGSVVLDQPEEQKLSGIKKALVPLEKVESTPIEKRSAEDMLTRAKNLVDSGEVNPKNIAETIAKGDARALQADEVASLVYYKTQLDNKVDQVNSDLVKAMESGQDQAALRTELNALNQEVDNYHTMAIKTAYEQSLAFSMRKMLLDNEYNLQSQVVKYKAANNGQISPEMEEKFKTLDKELKAANAKIKELESKQSVAMSEEAAVAIRQDLQAKRERRKVAAQAKKEKINTFFDSLKVKADPNKLNSITQVIGETIYNSSVEAMRLAVLAGATVAETVQAGIDYVNEHYRGNDFNEDDFRKRVTPGVESLIPERKEVIRKPEMKNGRLFIPSSLIKSVAETATDINDLTDKVHAMVKDVLPDVDKRTVRDAITRYGETKSLSKEEIDVRLRGMKRVGKMISSLEDIQNKKRPLRSGLQRDKLSDQERKMLRDIKDAMKDLPVDEAEEAKSWKTTLDTIKSRLKNQIADLNKQIETGEKTAKKKGIKYDQEADDLRAQRDELKKVIEAMEGKSKMSDEQKIRMAVAAVEKNIAELERRIATKDVSKKDKSVAPVTDQLRTLRQKRDALKKTFADIEKELGVTDKRRLETYKKAIKRSSERYEERLKNKEFVTQKKKPVEMDKEATDLKLERDKIKQQFDIEQEKARYKNRPLSEKIWDTTVDIFNLPKSFLASIDMSAPFRQGAILSISNPKVGARSFEEMFRQAFSEKKANEWLLKLRESPEYALIKQSKLYVAEPTTKLIAKEETFISNLAGKIPIVGRAIKASERAYTGYLNKLRVDVFANGADLLREQGISPEANPEAYKSLANFINNATGRGNLGGAEMAAPLLNALFFSPRYVVSRFNLINPVVYAKMPAPVRKMALKSVATYIGFTVTMIALMDAASDDLDVEWDPRSSDFAKVRFGNTRFDPWAGFQQVVRVISQLISGQRKSTKSGVISNLDGSEFPHETRADVALRFGRSKLSPTSGTIANILAGENIVGEEVTVQSELLKNIIPLYLQDIGEIYDEEGPTGIITSAIPAFFGIGVQSYGGNSGLKNKEYDPTRSLQQLNQDKQYSFSQPSRVALSKSFGNEVDDDTYDEYYKLRDQEISKVFNQNKPRLQNAKDVDVYDKMMDAITRHADKVAKYKIATKKGWEADEFRTGGIFMLKFYKKNKDGKVVEAAY